MSVRATTAFGDAEWQLELQVYDRFRFNLYDNFSDRQFAPDGTLQHGSSDSFNTSRKEDDRLRFSTPRGYATAAIKKASVAQLARTGVLGCRPLLHPAFSYSQTPGGGPTKDIGQEFDVLVDYFHGLIRLLSYFGMFLPSRLTAPDQDYALKYEIGVEYRF
jgi:hypothetical protein